MAVSANIRRNSEMPRPVGPESRLFRYDPLSTRVVFGYAASQQLPDELARLNVSRALVLCTPGRRAHAHDLAARLGGAGVDIFSEARMHVPFETAMAARAAARRIGADNLIAVGGGSAIGLAKAVALETGLPIIAVPTT